MSGETGRPFANQMQLTDPEKSFLDRIIRRKKLFLKFSLVGVVVSVAYFIYHAVIAQDLTVLRSVVVILLLLSARSHLRQYRSAVIMDKLRALSAIESRLPPD